MLDIASNIRSLRQQMPATVKIVAVSKTNPVSAIMEAYSAGQRMFGENRVHELLQKKDLLPADIEWHMIGHLQTNKVKLVVPVAAMIQSVDSFRLLKTINAEASKINRTVNCLLQFFIADEETKYGFSMNEAEEMLDSDEFRAMQSVRICGVMGMATFIEDAEQIKREFRHLAECYKRLKSNYYAEEESFREISMGMSGDYEIAIGEGSTMVRIGSLIFGSRNK
ncbi:MAG: YggS family pyridoxal phosphate-dependent enzyme [Bacteroidales bacterium]|nr:YggS family pyridoxal phosphate-dependent enzyme [Deltaproteobacteria bacterium]MBN2667073.1 YggS family pyridoxal phosphate-dependent enzyme [Bacteroidales bacterium]